MNKLQGQSTSNSFSEYHINLLQSRKFWIMIFSTTGSNKKLSSHGHITNTRNSINKLAEMISQGSIDIQFLRKILRYKDEDLIYYFDKAVLRRDFTEVILTK